MNRGFKLIVLLALIAGLGPMSIHVILPALPSIKSDFNASNTVTQLTLTLGVITMAVATIGFGPAADRFGRRPVTICGLILYTAGSALCVWSPDIQLLVVGRVVQALGGGAGIVVARAIIRDLYNREETARVLGQVMSIIVFAPILAPVLGGFISEILGWHAVFMIAAAMGFIALAAVLPGLRETRPSTAQAQSLLQVFRAFPGLLSTPAFVAYAGYAGCGMGMFMVVAGGAPFMIVESFDLPPSAFGLYFMLLTGSFFFGTLASSRLTERVGLDNMIRIGSTGAASFSILIPVLFLSGAHTPWSIFIPGFAMGLCHGLAMPNAQAGAVSVNPQLAGSASGLMTFTQLSIGAGFGQIAGMIPHDSALPLAFLIATAGLGAFLIYNVPMIFERRRLP